MAVQRVGNTTAKVNKRAAQQAKQAQDLQHAEAIRKKQASDSVQSYIDPSTGKDTRNIVAGAPSMASDVTFIDEFGRTVKGINYSEETPTAMSGGSLSTQKLSSIVGSQAPMATTSRPTTSSDVAKNAQKTYQDLTQKANLPTQQRLTNAGISTEDVRMLGRIQQLGDVTGTIDGYMVFAGNEPGTHSGITEYQWRNEIVPKLEKYQQIQSGKDVQDLQKQISEQKNIASSANADVARAESTYMSGAPTITSEKNIAGQIPDSNISGISMAGQENQFSTSGSPVSSPINKNQTTKGTPGMATMNPLSGMGLPEDISNMFDPIGSLLQQSRGRAEDIYGQALSSAKEGRDMAFDVFNAGRGDVLRAYEERLKFNDELTDLQRERSQENQRKQLAEVENAQQLAKVENARAEQVLREQNADAEMQNRRYAAKLGINFDTGGLQFMQDSIRKGKEALSYLIQKTSASNTQFADMRLSIINDFSMGMKEIDYNARANYASAYADYQTEIKSLRDDFFSADQTASQAEQEATKNYYAALDKIDTDTGNLYYKMIEEVREREKTTAENEKWSLDYDFKVQKEKNDMAFNREKFTAEFTQKAQELALNNQKIELEDWNKQFQTRQSIISDISGAIGKSEAISSYEKTYRPNWDNFMAAYAIEPGKSGRNEAISKAFEGLIGGAQAIDPGLLASIPLLGKLTNTRKVPTDAEVDDMLEVATSIFSKAQERRNADVAKIMAPVQKTNLQFTNDFFKISPEDIGLQTAPLSKESLDIIETLPDTTKSRITEFKIGEKKLRANYEMQLRLKEADRMFYADTGQHIKIAEAYRSTERQGKLYAMSQAGEIGRAAPPGHSEHERGAAVDIDPSQWQIVQPYLIKVGLQQLPADIDQEDAAHFSLTGR